MDAATIPNLLMRAQRHGLAFIIGFVLLSACNADVADPNDQATSPEFAELLEPPTHAPGEPHAFADCADGVCPREQPAHLFSGEFHETVVDLRVESCTVGLDLVWARRYRSRLPMPSGQTPLGNGWDHSYNIYLELSPTTPLAVTIHDGNARPAQFTQDRGSGLWTAPKYHRFGAYDDSDRFVLTFADGGAWVFKSTAESADDDIRRLWRIIDRHGNVVELEYDAQDRLERIVNAVGQSLELTRDAADHIVAVTAKLDASTERQVTYQYYGADDPNGGRFDLQRVTLPPVAGVGATTTYTYSTGSDQAALNGNLLTIEDSRAQVYLRNTYASTRDPGDLQFDRLVSQVWGDPDDLFSLVYVALKPSPANAQAVTKTWMNDRVGRVSEHFFDADNQLVMVREYTGLADPSRPTGETSNHPTGQLRPGDPTYFETRYGYNVDGHVSWTLHPRGNKTVSVYEVDINPSASPQTRGNLREHHREGQLCSPEFEAISEYYEYQPGRGNEHGERNFVTRVTDPRGNVTDATYDRAGNRTSVVYPEPNTREDMQYSAVGQMTNHQLPKDRHGKRREIGYTYANDGRLRETIVDTQLLNLTTRREFDVACNELRRVDPRGNDKLFTYNERNQLIRERSELTSCPAACGGGDATRSNTDHIYDANSNLVRVDYEARDCDGTPQANPVVSTWYEYDILNHETATRTEIGPDHQIVNRFTLDANGEVTGLRYGQATTGADPFNTVNTVYDARGLIYREIHGQGSAQASTTQHDYDANGNLTLVQVGLEGPIRSTTHSYDCADRLIATVDPMGNRTEFDYDLAGNVVEQRLYGELDDVPGATANVLLERVTSTYDNMNRRVETSRDHFDPVTLAAIGDGASTTTSAYDGESRVFIEQDDNGDQTKRLFDTAGRPTATSDPVGNLVWLEYDNAGNIVTRKLTDVPTTGGVVQVGVWTSTYDEQNNLVASVDALGNTRHACYDSLGRLAEEIDERGNRTLHEYDGNGRLLESTHVLTDTGDGAGVAIDTAVVRQTWDDSDRLIAREDPNGNVTTYQYDSLNRLTTETFADGTSNSLSYDVHGNVSVSTDPNHTSLTNTYDGLERLSAVAVSPGPTLDASTSFESFAYDARSLLVRAVDDDSEVSRAYDSLGALLSETQIYFASPTPRTVGYTRDGLGNALTTHYPGGRQIERSFDGLSRTQRIDEAGETLVELDYLGPNIVRKVYLAANTQSDYSYDVARRMTSSEHVDLEGGTIDHRAYVFDATGNKQSEQDLAPGSLAGLRSMEHDSLGRMVDSEVTGSTMTDRSVDYALDRAGNRTGVSGDACPGAYGQDGADAPLNQYTQTACESWSHDAAGNLVETEAAQPLGHERTLVYDHRGRLTQAWVGLEAELVLEFAYDALGRKVHSSRSDIGGTIAETYIYSDGNVIEEYLDDVDSPSATYLYGDGLDARLQMVRDLSWWYLDDELGSASALVHRPLDGPLLVERYAYQDYGAPTFFWNGAPINAAVSGNPYLFAASRWIPGAGLYDLRTRHLDTLAGRFISRDSVGIWGDEDSLGNGYTYVSNAPGTHTDPTGEWKKPAIQNCKAGARDQIEDSLAEAERIARLAENWFNGQANRKRKHRKKDWNAKKNAGRTWWGKYQITRFNRIRYNHEKIARRCSKNVITFKCRSTGSICGYINEGRAWTYSAWHSKIRLCIKSDGFFKPNGKLFDRKGSGGTIAHEVSHNINAIGDKKLNGNKMTGNDDVQRLAAQKPGRASWNASNYQRFAVSR